jgi:4-amino-4-deoxy-L-arabinose transferase-like glycosyltransferase
MWGWKKNNLLLIIILFIAFLLRVYQLGQDSFWFDEAGVVVAASTETLSETLQVAQSHVSAMPFNYLQTRFLLTFGNSEAWLRLPSSIWGTLAVFAFYKLTQFLTNQKTALLASLLLAIQPLHIYYSQELRFYSSGTFFYLFGTFLLLLAMKKNNILHWGLAVFVILIGAYDFPYTVFAWINVVFISAVTPDFHTKDKWRNLFIIGVIIGIGFLPGYLIFGIEKPMNYVVSTDLIIQNLLQGLGWLPFIESVILASYWMGFLLFLTFIISVLVLIKQKVYNLLIFLISNLFQIGLIIASVVHLNYFISARQFLVFLPTGLICSSYLLVYLLDYSQPIFFRKAKFSSQNLTLIRKINFVFAASIMVLTVILAIPALTNYYQSSKSYAREVSKILALQIQPTDIILCVPEFEPLLFKYYLQKNNVPLIENQLIGLNINDLTQLEIDKKNVYLITRSDLKSEEVALILDKGFKIAWIGPGKNSGIHRLYIHTKY